KRRKMIHTKSHGGWNRYRFERFLPRDVALGLGSPGRRRRRRWEVVSLNDALEVHPFVGPVAKRLRFGPLSLYQPSKPPRRTRRRLPARLVIRAIPDSVFRHRGIDFVRPGENT